VIFCAVYAFIFLFGTFYIYRLIRTGPRGQLFETAHDAAVPNRPMSLANARPVHEPSHVGAGE
jgi:cytochrome d ubiquinol oxidase subunit I